MTDQELVDLVLNKDKNYFEKILEKYQRQIFVYILHLLNFHNEDAEDVLNETFMKVYVNLASYNPKMKFSSWVYRIAHNEAVNYIKKKSKTLASDIENTDIGYEIDFDKPKKGDLEKILNKLKVGDRNLLVLFYLEERTVREISDILKISEGNVKTKLSRARKKAQKLVK